MMHYKYCPVCGADVQPHVLENNVVEKYSCSSCGFDLWQNSSPTASAIIADEQSKVLLAQRGIEPYKGWWDLPGGYLQNGEEPIAGLRREIREELGVEIEIGRLIGVYIDRYGEDGIFTFNLFYQATIKSGEIEVGDDVVGYDWFALDDLPTELAFNCVRQVLDDFVHA